MNWGLFLVLQKGSLHQREMQGARSYEMLLLIHSFKPSLEEWNHDVVKFL